MSIAEQLLAQITSGTPTDELLMIDQDTRKITISQKEQIFGVVCDGNSEAKYFGVHRRPTSDVDLAGSRIVAKWTVLANDENIDDGRSEIKEQVYDEDNMVFKWLLPPEMFLHAGKLEFNLHFHLADGSKWHTAKATGTILDGQFFDEPYDPDPPTPPTPVEEDPFDKYMDASLKVLDEPDITSIWGHAFQNFQGLHTVNIPNCTVALNYAFSDCEALYSVNAPSLVEIGFYAFEYCYALSEINMPLLRSIGSYAFRGCYASLTECIFPECTTIGAYAFYGCSALGKIVLPKIKTIGAHAFDNSDYIYHVDLGPDLTKLSYTALRVDFLETLILRSPTVVTLDGRFSGSEPGSMHIYVPSELIEQYKTATNWTRYAKYFVGIEELDE